MSPSHSDSFDDIRARLAAANTGVWQNAGWANDDAHAAVIRWNDARVVAEVPAEAERVFIAHAPTDVATLLDAVDALQDALQLAARMAHPHLSGREQQALAALLEDVLGDTDV